MRIQSSHPFVDRDLDAYFTPPEATDALIHIEQGRLPFLLWEPAAGNGAISKKLKGAGYCVVSSDIADYGYKACISNRDYLLEKPPPKVNGIVTNPPFKLAAPFLEKALSEVPYVAFLLRTNFLESTSRLPLFRRNPPARVHISSRRLPMMHRHGWIGPTAPSNTCFAWFIWDQNSPFKQRLDWFDWKNLDI